MITLDMLKKLAESGEIETVVMGFTNVCGQFIGKRYDIDFFLEEGINGTHACNYLMTIDIEQAVLPGFDFTSWAKGFGDFILYPDMKTLRFATWLPKTALVICTLTDKSSGDSIPIGPRNILIDQAKKMKDKWGFDVSGASELEYFMYRNSYEALAAAEHAESALIPYGHYLGDYNLLQSTREEPFNSKVRRHLKNSGVPLENSKGEYGLGQHELNVKYTEVVTMADRHVVFKQCFKEVAMTEGMSVTFMAKPHKSQSGSSCHIHISLAKDGKNAFNGDEEFEGMKCSKVFLYFLGGLLKNSADLMVFFAPTINSYKRFQSGTFAPTKLAWSIDNRSAGFRILPGGPGFRIECRIPGADCNPYLAFSALLAAGMDGLENKIHPGPALSGDLYNTEGIPECPRTLRDAVQSLKSSDFARRTLGDAVVNHYAHYYDKEVQGFNDFVTDWERKRYFEQI